ncbi:MAG: hypothetical protein AAGA93_05725 [Actinomycetota bacterium]
MRFRTPALASTLGLALVLAACGGGDDTTTVAPAAADPAAAEAAAPVDDGPATIDVLSGDSAIGPILVGPDGLSLYGFTNDVDAVSTCYGTCADAWPPVIVSDDWTAGPGLDFGIFATTVREDGQRQLVAGRWPLYYFAGDATPGDVKGQGSGDVWFAVDVDGSLITEALGGEAAVDTDGATADAGSGDAADDSTADDAYGYDDDSAAAGSDDSADAAGAAAAPVVAAETELGPVLVDAAGLTLYGFLPDRDAGAPTCDDACADAWPPVIVDGTDLPAGLDPEIFSVMTRSDGSNQLAAGIWPLYRFAGDAAPGDVNGQGSGDVWFAATPDGKLVGAP